MRFAANLGPSGLSVDEQAVKQSNQRYRAPRGAGKFWQPMRLRFAAASQPSCSRAVEQHPPYNARGLDPDDGVGQIRDHHTPADEVSRLA